MSTPEEPAAPPRLESLAALLPAFEEPDFEALRPNPDWEPKEEGGDYQWPPFFETKPINDFVSVAYEDGWISPAVDWPEWIGTEEGERLTSDPQAVGAATVEQLQCLMTALVRGDRFTDGLLATKAQEGLLTAILRRVEALRSASETAGSADA